MHADVVIVGGGQAGCDVAFGLRQRGFEGSILLLGREPWLPYRRPPLSKQYLLGKVDFSGLLLKPEASYEKFSIHYRLEVEAESLDTALHELRLNDGSRVGYRHLVLATGGEPRRLECGPEVAERLFYIRTVEDIERLRARLVEGARAVIIGGGYIGLETAAVLRQKGLEVSLIEAAPRLLERAFATQLSEFFRQYHADHGVQLHLDQRLEGLEGDDREVRLTLRDGQVLHADLVVVGIGLVPNVDIARAAGLHVQRGIVVDEFCRASAADVFAVGDCAEGLHPLLGRHMVLESVGSASEQARVVASVICGNPTAVSGVPWFWSEQYDIKLQTVGISQGYDQVLVRGSLAERSFAFIYLRDAKPIAVDLVNRAHELTAAKKLIEKAAPADAARLADVNCPLE